MAKKKGKKAKRKAKAREKLYREMQDRVTRNVMMADYEASR